MRNYRDPVGSDSRTSANGLRSPHGTGNPLNITLSCRLAYNLSRASHVGGEGIFCGGSRKKLLFVEAPDIGCPVAVR